MTKIAALAMVLMMSCAACAVHLLHPARGATPREQFQGAVLVTTSCPDENGVVHPTAEGTGFIVPGDHVITAAHVVDCDSGTPVVTVDPGDGTQRSADIEVVLPGRDMVRLHVGADMSAWASPTGLGPAPEIGDRVCWTSMAPIPTRRCGEVSPGPTGKIWIAGVVLHGNSGGPLYDAAGRLVGVIQATMKCSGAGYCIGQAEPLTGLGWLISE